jgi:hypothetical protein
LKIEVDVLVAAQRQLVLPYQSAATKLLIFESGDKPVMATDVQAWIIGG